MTGEDTRTHAPAPSGEPMNWLIHNPIADLSGPAFLALYVLVIALAAWAARRAIRSNDATTLLDPPEIPLAPDPYEVAYLRGGPSELTRLILFDLMRRGFLKPRALAGKRNAKALPSTIERDPDHPDPAQLSALERTAFEAFTKPRDVAELFRPRTLAYRIRRGTEPLERRLQEEQLLSPPSRYGVMVRARLLAAAQILSLGGYKVAVAFATGRRHDVDPLPMISFFGVGAVCSVSQMPRLTRLGRAHLDRLRTAFRGLKTPKPATASAAPDPILLLTPALFGVAALAGTPYAYVSPMFPGSKAQIPGGSCGECGGGCGVNSCGGGCGG